MTKRGSHDGKGPEMKANPSSCPRRRASRDRNRFFAPHAKGWVFGLGFFWNPAFAGMTERARDDHKQKETFVSNTFVTFLFASHTKTGSTKDVSLLSHLARVWSRSGS
jgi:hypothetical protein